MLLLIYCFSLAYTRVAFYVMGSWNLFGRLFGIIVRRIRFLLAGLSGFFFLAQGWLSAFISFHLLVFSFSTSFFVFLFPLSDEIENRTGFSSSISDRKAYQAGFDIESVSFSTFYLSPVSTSCYLHHSSLGRDGFGLKKDALTHIV